MFPSLSGVGKLPEIRVIRGDPHSGVPDVGHVALPRDAARSLACGARIIVTSSSKGRLHV